MVFYLRYRPYGSDSSREVTLKILFGDVSLALIRLQPDAIEWKLHVVAIPVGAFSPVPQLLMFQIETQEDSDSSAQLDNIRIVDSTWKPGEI